MFKKNPEKAVEYYEKATTLMDYGWSWCDLGNCYLEKENPEPEKALDCFDKASKVVANQPFDWHVSSAFHCMGHTYWKFKKEYDKAIECYKKAIELCQDPNHWHYKWSWWDLEQCYLQKGIIEKAKSKMKEPELCVSIVTDIGFKVGRWYKVHATVKNVGENVAKDIKISISGPIELGGVKPISKLETGGVNEIILGIKPTGHGNLPLDVSISYMDKNDTIFEINDVTYISVAKEDETASIRPQSIFNIGSIGEVIGEGAIKTNGVGIIRGGYSGSPEKAPSNTPHCKYCGTALDQPDAPFCGHCGKQIE